jgi:hypothetical protein
MNDYVVYTYAPGPLGTEPVCHAYGPVTKEQGEAERAKLERNATTIMSVMLVPLEPVPA